jgi:hypothetical protein
LSLYVHIPFCESVCYYCACNKVITKHHDRGRVPGRAVARKSRCTSTCWVGQAVSQLHFGGGSPTFLSDDELEWLMDMLRSAFKLAPKAEISIEVDPRTASPSGWRTWPPGLQPHQLRRAGLRPRRAEGGAPRAVVREVRDLVWLPANCSASSRSMPT